MDFFKNFGVSEAFREGIMDIDRFVPNRLVEALAVANLRWYFDYTDSAMLLVDVETGYGVKRLTVYLREHTYEPWYYVAEYVMSLVKRTEILWRRYV